MTEETNDNKVVVSGEVTVLDAINLTRWNVTGDYFLIIDLTQAQFTEEDEKYRRCMGMSHSGPVYVGEEKVRKVSALQTLLERLRAGTVILPASVTKKQLNICIKSESIGQIIVPDDCKLFSMKDGSIWNKKGTILIHEQHGAPEFATCECCGRSFLASAGVKTVDGGHICPYCKMTFYNPYGGGGPYIPFGDLYYHEDDPRLAELIAKEGTTMEMFKWNLFIRGKW